MTRKYSGEVEWHTGEPPKSGIYLISHNGYAAEWKFYKTRSKSYWESYTESEDGSYQTMSSVQAWTYLPTPYVANN